MAKIFIQIEGGLVQDVFVQGRARWGHVVVDFDVEGSDDFTDKGGECCEGICF